MNRLDARLRAYLIYAAAVMLLAACGMQLSARPQNLVPQTPSVPEASPLAAKFAHSVFVTPAKGDLRSGQFNWAGGFPISPETFRDAAVQALRNSGLFTNVTTDPPADYRLDINVVKGNAKPDSLFSTEKSTLFVSYKLLRLSDGQTLWQDDYYSEAIAPLTPDGPAVGKEEAVRKNLEQLVRGLATAKLGSQTPSGIGR